MACNEKWENLSGTSSCSTKIDSNPVTSNTLYIGNVSEAEKHTVHIIALTAAHTAVLMLFNPRAPPFAYT